MNEEDFKMDYILTADGELYHYGVKGMKWGIRSVIDSRISEEETSKWINLL
jgi:hypothetical protein